MDTLCRVHIDNFRFWIGDAITLFVLGRHEIRLQLGNGLISVYSRLVYTDGNGTTTITEAEGSKVECLFAEALEKTVAAVVFEPPAYLALRFEDDTILKIDGANDGYEAFIAHGPKGQLWVFN